MKTRQKETFDKVSLLEQSVSEDTILWPLVQKRSCRQGGITCGAINEPRKSSKAIDECVIINFRDKNVVIARITTKMRFLF